nr:hypothetical protein [Tanacetum cinerariifolium]
MGNNEYVNKTRNVSILNFLITLRKNLKPKLLIQVPNEEGSSGRDGRVHQLVTRANIDQPRHDDTHLATLVGEHNISEGNVCSYNKIPQVLSFQNVLPNLTKECGLRRSQRSSKLPAGLNNFVLDSKVKYGLNRFANHSVLSPENFCFVSNSNTSVEPSFFKEAANDANWISHMNDEIYTLYLNNT